MTLLGITDKVRESSGPPTYTFGIPAHVSKSGLITCPGANGCQAFCYAKKRRYNFANVVNALESRLEHSRKRYFEGAITYEIRKLNAQRIRVHDSGDFYSRTYALKWFDIANYNPNTVFYAYTKSIEIFKPLQKHFPKNFTFIYSYGGNYDHLINPKKDRHSKIFNSLTTMRRHGYSNASKDDSIALGKNKKIGLLIR